MTLGKNSVVSFEPYLLTLNKAVKASKGQTPKLTWTHDEKIISDWNEKTSQQIFDWRKWDIIDKPGNTN